MPITDSREIPYAFLVDLSRGGKYILLYRSEKFTLDGCFHIVEWNGDILLCPVTNIELNGGKEPYRTLQHGDVITVTTQDQENEKTHIENVFIMHIPPFF